ncbi:hypothetical protein ACHQM5_013945 [Ranunculus cassubicifolius]
MEHGMSSKPLFKEGGSWCAPDAVDHSASPSSGCKRPVPADELVQLAQDRAKRGKSKEGHVSVLDALQAENAELRQELQEVLKKNQERDGEFSKFLEALQLHQSNNDTLQGQLVQAELERSQLFEQLQTNLTTIGQKNAEGEMLRTILQDALSRLTQYEAQRLQQCQQLDRLKNERQQLQHLAQAQCQQLEQLRSKGQQLEEFAHAQTEQLEHCQSERHKLHEVVQALRGESHLQRQQIDGQRADLVRGQQVHNQLGRQVNQLRQQLAARQRQLQDLQQGIIVYHLVDEDPSQAAAAPSETVVQLPNAPSTSSASTAE